MKELHTQELKQVSGGIFSIFRILFGKKRERSGFDGGGGFGGGGGGSW